MQLSPISLAITRLGGVRFSPSALFATGAPGVWYDPSDASTLFEDTAGTTPSPTPGGGALSVVGLMLDKSQGLVLGPELITNGTFDTNITGWTAQSGLSSATRDTTIFTTGGLKIVANGASNTYATQTISGLTAGRQYVISTLAYTPSTNPTNNRATIGIQATSFTTSGSIAQPATNTIQTLTIRFFATSTTQTIYCSVVTADFLNWGANGAEAYFDNISVRELPGNHAISYNSTTARPELSARVNLLRYSEDWTNAVWTGASDRTNVTTTPNAGTNPIGGSNATRLQGTANNWYQGQTVSLTSLTPLVLSLWVKSNTGSSQTFRLFGTGTAQISSDLTATTDWQRFSFPYTPTNTAQQCGIIRNSSNSTADLLIWGAQLIATNAFPANTYQRIADQYTYDNSASFPRYLRFDGVDDGMSTRANLDLTSTDKATVFAGVRKLSDANPGMLIEYASINGWTLDNGAFAIYAPSYISGTLPAPKYFQALRGSGTSRQEEYSTFTAPISNVIADSLNIGAAAASELVMRINGTAVSPSAATGDAGTGNFGNYLISIGQRPTGSPFLNGYLYSLIVVGAASTAAQISSTESWINVKEGTVY